MDMQKATATYFAKNEKAARTVKTIARLQAGETAYSIAKDLGVTSPAVDKVRNKYLTEGNN